LKILIVGGNREWAIERYYLKYLKELGAEVHLYEAPDIVFSRHSKSLFHKILFKTGIDRGYRAVNLDLIQRAADLKPDIIWVFKGMEIYPATLEKLRPHYKLANYNPDHPFEFGSRGSGNKNVRDGVPFYHLHFCYSRKLRAQIETDYKIPTVFLPFGYELNEEDYRHATQEPEIQRVCFLGNPDSMRVEAIRLIAENGFAIDVYGHGWNKTILKNLPNVSVSDAVYGTAFWKKLRQYRIQLNIFRRHNEGSHNMRTFEIPAVGGIQLAPYSPEQESFISRDKEIFFYNNGAEMIGQIKKLMNDPADEISVKREASRLRSLKSGYSYRDRSETVYRSFQSLLKNE
jgi:spore maturation protein CgeB